IQISLNTRGIQMFFRPGEVIATRRRKSGRLLRELELASSLFEDKAFAGRVELHDDSRRNEPELPRPGSFQGECRLTCGLRRQCVAVAGDGDLQRQLCG